MTATTTTHPIFDGCPDCAAGALEPHAPGCASNVTAQLHVRAEFADETHRKVVAEGTAHLADSIIEDHDFGTALISLGMYATVLRAGADLIDMDRDGRIDLTQYPDLAHLVDYVTGAAGQWDSRA